MKKIFRSIDNLFITEMHHWGIPLLRVALGIVFLWFGALKIFGLTPVRDLIEQTYWFIPYDPFILFLGVWEIIIGIGLLAKLWLRGTLFLLWLQMAGTLFAAVLAPHMFFIGNNLFMLTVEGEFIVKNIVLIAASLVIGGYEVHKKHSIKDLFRK